MAGLGALFSGVRGAAQLGQKAIDLANTDKETTDSGKILRSLVPGAQFRDFIGGLNTAKEFILTMDRSFAKLASTMGVGSKQTLLIKENLARTTEEVILMGGKFDDVVKLQEDFLSTSGKAVLMNQEIAKSIYATTKVTGIEGKTLLENFMDVGYEADNIAENMLKVQKQANIMGVNAKAVSSLVVSNLDKLNKFTFEGGVEGLAKMASKAAMFRIDMNETFSLAERLLSPENAIETANALQRLGGATSQLADPLRLMDLAQNNVPELQNQLSKLMEKYTYFDEKTKSFQIMPGARREIKAIGDALNISEKNMFNMGIEGAKLKKKMSEINFDGLNFNEEQRQQIANLSNLKGGKYQIEFEDSSGKTVSKTLDELKNLNAADKAKFEEYLSKQTDAISDDPQKQMVNLAKDQLGKADTMIASINSLKMAIPLAVGGSKEGGKFLDEIYKLQQNNYKDFIEQSKFDNTTKNLGPVLQGQTDILKSLNDKDWSGALTATLALPKKLADSFKDSVPQAYKEKLENLSIVNLLNTFDDNLPSTQDFIWRPGQGITKFLKDDLLIGGTGLISKSQEMPMNTTQKQVQTIIENKTETTTSEMKMGGEVTFKVSLDTNGNLGNLGMNEATVLGNRIADAIKSSPDLQNKIKAALEFSKV